MAESDDSQIDIIPRRSEILCFIADKVQSMAVDDIVKICCDFYTESEVISAREVLQCCISTRLKKRQGDDRVKMTVEDLVKQLLHRTADLPTFYAVDISRLPPVDITHCDVSAILVELQGLRREVRDIKMLKEEIDSLKADLADLRSMQGEFRKMQQTAGQHQQVELYNQSVLVDTTEDKLPTMSGVKTAASILVEAMKSGALASTVAATNATRKKPAPVKFVVGTKTNTQIRGVDTRRNVDMFISRLQPHTTAAELIESVTAAKGDLNIHEVTATKLKPKFEHLYASFHIRVTVSSQHFKQAIDLVNTADIWPSGVLVRRYFPPKDGTTG